MEMDPPIKDFIPAKIFTEQSKVEVKDLASLIEDAEVADAILVYKLLQKSNIEVPKELKQSFFELICFYNCEDPMDEDLVEERWFKATDGKERFRKTWRDHDLAEQMFAEIEPKDSKAFSTIIRGMCKHFQVEKAWAFFNDATARNLELDVETFNSVINVVNFLKESTEMRYELILELLSHMRTSKIEPNLGTLNACMSSISVMGTKAGLANPRDYALQILSEFKTVEIEPSLATWYFVLQTFCKDRGPVSHVLIDILNQIDGKEFTIQDTRDTMFFVKAMDVCKNHLFDKNLAKRVDALLHTGNNYNLIGDSYRESTYYRHYFSLLVATEPLDVFMEYYHRMVPNIYIPEPFVVQNILQAIETSGAIEHIPQIWTHIVMFEQITREDLLNLVAKIMIENKPNPSIPQHENLNVRFAAIANDMWLRIEDRNEFMLRSKPVVWSGKLLGDIITLLCRVEDHEKASEVFNKLSTDQQKILGEPDVQALQEFVQLCIKSKQPTKAVQCLQYSYEVGFPESRNLAKSIVHGFTLDEHQTKRVAYLAGLDVLQEVAAEKLKAADKS